MRESSMYEIILEEGMQEALSKMILVMGSDKFGPPPPSVEDEIKAISDIDRLFHLGRRLLVVASWDELLAPA